MPKGKSHPTRKASTPSQLEESVLCRVCGAKLKVIQWTHLRTHGLTPNQYRRDYKEDFLTSPLLRWRKAVTSSLGAQCQPPASPRSRAEMLRDIKRFAQECAGPLTVRWLRSKDPNLFRQSTRLLGGWGAVLRAAGLPYLTRECWSPQRVVKRIRQRMDSGHGLAHKIVTALEPKLVCAGRAYFGSWAEAVAAAGVGDQRYMARRIPLSRTETESALRSWVARHGPLSHAALAKTSPRLVPAIRRIFGTPRKAARALGLPYKRPISTKWSRGTIIAALVSMVAKDQTVSAEFIRAQAPALSRAAQRHFGTLAEALKVVRATVALQKRGANPSRPTQNTQQLKESTADAEQ